MSSVPRKGKAKVDSEEEAPTIITTSAQSLSEMDEEEYYDCDIFGELSSGILSSEPNSRENSNVIVEEKVNSDDNESKNCTTCQECGKTFRSMKSLYGHLRSHPKRGYRGAKPPPKRKSFTHAYPSDENQSRAKTSRIDDDLEDLEYVANIMIMMSSLDARKPFSLRQRDTWGSVDHTQALEEPIQIDNKADKIYQCNACGKTFNTHQALGGHTAAHKKQKSTSDGKGCEENVVAHDGPSDSAAKAAAFTVHKCKECHETFASGQALGGHMRRHWTGPPSSGVVSEEEEEEEEDEENGRGRDRDYAGPSSSSVVVSGEEENGRERDRDYTRPLSSVVVSGDEENGRRGQDRDCTGLPDSVVVSGEEENGRERDRGFDLNQDAQSEE